MNYQLDSEEQEILDAFERSELVSADHAESLKELAVEAAKNSMNKTRRINLRLTERDYQLAHAKALEEGSRIKPFSPA